MGKKLDIWSDDRLGRMAEAFLLETHLVEEYQRRCENGTSDSYVLAIDAPYGQGKSWFLNRFREHLSEDHPVAFVDAWVDDANSEPMVPLMASIKEALGPYLSKSKKISESFGAASRAALPIIGKAITGGGAKFAQRYLGEAIFDEAQDEIVKALKSPSKVDKSEIEDALATAVDKAGDAISALVDKQAEEMIAEYQNRKSSRTEFKARMEALIDQLGGDAEGKGAPLFVIVDELDRCRPDYAIKVLEGIKHLFDVRGVVFIIALHGDQLRRSVNAVYGAEFDSSDYLRRFFSRRYELRELSVKELTTELYHQGQIKDEKFFVPYIRAGINEYAPKPAKFIGLVLDELEVTARETHAVMAMLVLFHDNWHFKFHIELVALLPMIVNLVRGENPSSQPAKCKNKLLLRGSVPNHDGIVRPVAFAEAAGAFSALMANPLPNISHRGHSGGQAYACLRFEEEFAGLHSSVYVHNDPPYSIINQYAGALRLAERFTDDVADTILAEGG